MASTFELLSQIMAETTEGIRNDPELLGATPQMMLVHKATVAGFEKMRSDLQRLRELADDTRVRDWLLRERGRDCRDGGQTAVVIELLDLLRSMA